MSDEQAAGGDPLLDFVNEVLQGHFGPDYSSATGIDRADVDMLLTDDTRRRVEEARDAAVEWGRTEIDGEVMIAADRLVITSHGLVYAAGMTSPGADRSLYYLATPVELFEPLVGHVDTLSLRLSSVAAVDDRFGHELDYPWPLDTNLRHLLDEHEALHLDLSDHVTAPHLGDR
ncbi:glucose-6-phosphate dehydrogenase [Gordonia sp. CPCC 205515]|uniref:glucose-6-phosphate dehydrogenase n=1 Tax=Gordonia sp. CPCC 205515 TaxID=3140791 RepID=UPI003AF3DF1B